MKTSWPEEANANAAEIVKKDFPYRLAAAVASLPYTESTVRIFPVGSAEGPTGPCNPDWVVASFPTPGM